MDVGAELDGDARRAESAGGSSAPSGACSSIRRIGSTAGLAPERSSVPPIEMASLHMCGARGRSVRHAFSWPADDGGAARLRARAAARRWWRGCGGEVSSCN